MAIVFKAAAGKIDSKAGVIRGCSVITAGEVRGHSFWMGGEEIGMFADATTLQQVKECAEGFGSGGVKVKVNHYSGFESIVGALRNFSIDGNQLRADLHLLETHEMRDRIMEMAEEIPDTFGFSIAFSGTPDVMESKAYARCKELYSVDLVDNPAANPSGLFSELVDLRETGSMQNENSLIDQIKSLVGFGKATLEAENSTLKTNLEAEKANAAQLQTQLTKLQADLEAEKAKGPEMEKAFAARVEDAAAKKAAEQLAQMGIKPLPIKAEETPAAGAKTVQQLWSEYRAIPDQKKRAEFYNANPAMWPAGRVAPSKKD